MRRPLIKLLRDWVISVRLYGPTAIAAFPVNRVRVSRAERNERFDDHFGTDTATVAYPWNLEIDEGEDISDMGPYEATPAWLIREILESIPLRPHEFTFVDLGSGKGRALLIASEFPFAKIEGVEVARNLHRIAWQNIGRYRSPSQQCTAFSLHCMNAADYEFRPEPLVVFLFNPCGKGGMRNIFARLEGSLFETPRETYVVYINPRFGSLSHRGGILRTVKKGGVWWRPWGRYEIYAASSSDAAMAGKPIRGRDQHQLMCLP